MGSKARHAKEIIQIATAARKFDDGLYALADDGTLWRTELGTIVNLGWQRIAPIPADGLPPVGEWQTTEEPK